MKIVELGWESYRQHIVPRNASQVQINETRTAFYAGASHLFGSIMSILGPGAEATETDLLVMDQIHEELASFARSKRG